MFLLLVTELPPSAPTQSSRTLLTFICSRKKLSMTFQWSGTGAMAPHYTFGAAMVTGRCAVAWLVSESKFFASSRSHPRSRCAPVRCGPFRTARARSRSPRRETLRRSMPPRSGRSRATWRRSPTRRPIPDCRTNSSDLPYDRYRDLRFVPERSIWRGEGLPFEVAAFPSRLSLFEPGRHIHRRGRTGPAARLFTRPVHLRAGHRRHRRRRQSRLRRLPSARPDEPARLLRRDRRCSRARAISAALAKDQGYGLSARGLAINTASPEGEEFPVFRSFWIERPAKGTSSIVVHALLDSESRHRPPIASRSARATYTMFDVEMAIYPRARMSSRLASAR